jgi:hypothetical protein
LLSGTLYKNNNDGTQVPIHVTGYTDLIIKENDILKFIIEIKTCFGGLYKSAAYIQKINY